MKLTTATLPYYLGNDKLLGRENAGDLVIRYTEIPYTSKMSASAHQLPEVSTLHPFYLIYT